MSDSVLIQDSLHRFSGGRGFSPGSWYDALIVASAIEVQSTILYTEDLQHAQQFRPLTISNPFVLSQASSG